MTKTPMEQVTATFILMSLLAIGMVSGAAWAVPQETPEPGFAWKDGAEVYAGVCVYCHGQGLRGAGVDPAKIRFTIRHGKGAMPAFRSAEIDDAALEKLVEYLSKKEPESK